MKSGISRQYCYLLGMQRGVTGRLRVGERGNNKEPQLSFIVRHEAKHATYYSEY